MSKKLAKASRADGWDTKLERAVSRVLSSPSTDEKHSDIVAVCEVLSEAFGVKVKPQDKDSKTYIEGLSLEPVNRFSARRGDVGFVLLEGTYRAGIVSSAGFVVLMPHRPLILPVSEIEQAYKVGA